MAEGVQITGSFAEVLSGKAELTVVVTGLFAEVIAGNSEKGPIISGVFLEVLGSSAYTDGVAQTTTARRQLIVWD